MNITEMIITVFFLSLIYGGKTTYVAYINQERSMIGASTFCADKCGGNLLSLNNRTMAILPQVVPSGAGFDISVGYYTTQSAWIEIYGCFEYNETLASQHVKKRKTYSDQEYILLQKDEKGFASSCQLFCHPLPYMAKVGQTCLCFSLVPSSTKVDSKKCHKNAELFNTEPGYAMYFKAQAFVLQESAEMDKQRGMNPQLCLQQPIKDRRVAPYKLRLGHFDGDVDDFYCSLVRCYYDYNDGKNKYEERKTKCISANSYRYFCIDLQQHLNQQLSTNRWKNSVLQCMKLRLYLTLSSEVTCKYSDRNQRFWIGEFKYQGMLLDREEKLQEFNDYTKCGYIKRTPSGFEFDWSSCRNVHRSFLCEYESLTDAKSECKTAYTETLELIGETTTESAIIVTTESPFETTESTEITEKANSDYSTETSQSKTELSLYVPATTISVNNTNNANKKDSIRKALQQNNTQGIILGVAVGVLVVVALIVLAMIILLKRRNKKNVEATSKEKDSEDYNIEVKYLNVNQATIDNVQITVKSSRYNNDSSNAQSNIEQEYSHSETIASYPCEFDKYPSPNSDETYYNVTQVESSKEDIYYSDLQEGDYDHLGNTRQHKEEPDEQILYDHTVTSTQRSSDIYDHTVSNSRNDDIDIYDHTAT